LDNKSNAAIKSNLNRVASPNPIDSLNPVLLNSVKPGLESKPVNVQKEIAKASGASPDTISKIKKILEKTPVEVIQKLRSDEIKDQPYGKSRRVKRGLYRSSTGQLINADVNGAESPKLNC